MGESGVGASAALDASSDLRRKEDCFHGIWHHRGFAVELPHANPRFRAFRCAVGE